MKASSIIALKEKKELLTDGKTVLSYVCFVWHTIYTGYTFCMHATSYDIIVLCLCHIYQRKHLVCVKSWANILRGNLPLELSSPNFHPKPVIFHKHSFSHLKRVIDINVILLFLKFVNKCKK